MELNVLRITKFSLTESLPDTLKPVIDALQVLEIISPHFHSDLFPTVSEYLEYSELSYKILLCVVF